MKTKKRISKEIPELIQHLEAKQRSGFKINLFVFVALLATLIFVAIWVSKDYAKRGMLKQLAEKQSYIKEHERRLEELQHASKQAELELDKVVKSLEISRLEYYEKLGISDGEILDLDLTTKFINENSRYRQQSELLNDILSMQKENVGWKVSGLSPEEGFDPPTFVAFILEKHGLLGKHRAVDVWYRLEEVIPRTDSPSMGDVVFYAYGYTMFYFMNDSGVPFVIGMTHLGILALKEDFVEKIGYGKINYSKQ